MFVCPNSVNELFLRNHRLFCNTPNWIKPTRDAFSKSQRVTGRFVDKKRLRIVAGRGGDGAVTFRAGRTKIGPPDGGNGGCGGSISIVVSRQVRELSHIGHSYSAENGKHGAREGRAGKSGENITLLVPPGTIARQIFDKRFPFDTICKQQQQQQKEDKEDKEEKEIKWGFDSSVHIGDLTKEGENVVVVVGGRGGRGNRSVTVPTRNELPTRTEQMQYMTDLSKGADGQQMTLELELKTIAHIGLLGYPNAGKSSLLASISNARPLVESYAFTTLRPNVGVAVFDDYSNITVADIPGIIEGASLGKGLGTKFLRHIERTLLLCYVVDMGAANPDSPLHEFNSLQQEIEEYMPGMSNRPSVVAANKMDKEGAANNLRYFINEMRSRKVHPLPVFPVSALTGDGLARLANGMRQVLDEEKKKNMHIL